MDTIAVKKAEPASLDAYVTDVLMRDLVGHDRAPSAFLVWLHLWARSQRRKGSGVEASLQGIADATGLSKSAVSNALAHLRRRRLVETTKKGETAIPAHRPLAPWRR